MRKYTAEQKAEGVRLAQDKGINPAARMLGVPPTTLYDWVKAAKHTCARQGVALEAADTCQENAKQGSEPEVEQKGEPAVVDSVLPQSQRTLKPRVARVYTPSQRAQALERTMEVGPVQVSK